MGTTQDIFWALSIGFTFVALLLLGFVVWRMRSGTGPNPRDDIASMMFLLQTMRDLLEQQKKLAQDFNKAFDARVELIKQTVGAARGELATLRDSVAAASSDLEKIRREAAEMHLHAATPQAPANVTAFVPSPHPLPEATKEFERPVLRVLAMPREPEPTDDIIDGWVGLDFAGDEPDPLGFEVPDIQPQAPHDADAARNAFRALLDMAPDVAGRSGPAAKSKEARLRTANGNGRPIPPVHARVYEYNDSGMSIAQIA
ncbi:MAG: hypothetical protein SGI88_00080 [Candidatus Hydrogenedentes bacterium]|nr:hypothetical protein [Candidatus Hydrogenedentota bacterium]